MLQSTGDNDMLGDNDVRINVNSINPRNFNTNSYNINSNIGYNNINNTNNSYNNSNRNNSVNSNNNQNMPILNAPTDNGARAGSGMYGGVGADSVGGFYSTAGGGGIGGTGSHIETDNKSISSTPSRISKFTYSGL